MPTANRLGMPALGVGIGVGAEHYARLVAERPALDWIAVRPEDAIESRGRTARDLDRLAEAYPIALHSVSMSIGSIDPVDVEYLDSLKALADRTGATWVSDHLGWLGVNGFSALSILPVPYDQATLERLVERVRGAQEILKRPLLIENTAAYFAFASASMPEEEFLARLALDADCGLVVDLGNLLVSRANGMVAASAEAYLEALPVDRVVALHLSGCADLETHCAAARNAPIVDEAWSLLANARARFPNCAIAIDGSDPGTDLEVLLGAASRVRSLGEGGGRDPATAPATPPAKRHRISAASSLQIYAETYRSRVAEILVRDYPVVAGTVARRAFADAAAEYASAHPPRSHRMSLVGGQFPDFLGAASPIPHSLRPFLSDLARLERAVDEVYDAAESPRLGRDGLGSIPAETWADARLEPVAALRLLALDFPVNGYYESALAGRQPAIPARAPCWLVVWRRDFQVWRADLDRWQYTILVALAAGRSLGDALEECLALPGVNAGELHRELASWFADWSADGLFAKVVWADDASWRGSDR